MKNIYVVGNRASKSLSPDIFNFWFKKYKIKARYGFLEVNKRDFNKKINNILKKKTTIGLNITIPYKREIINFADKLDKHSKIIGASNCLIVKKNKTICINTDWVGYKNSLRGFKINKKDKILILGYGGAAQAIYYFFLKDGFKNISVFNRTKKNLFIKTKKQTSNYNTIEKHLSKASLIINTTPTNILSKKQSKKIRPETIVSDIVYRPKNTNFLKQFKKNKKIYGIDMLINQAIPCFKNWFGFAPTADKELIKKLNRKIS